MRRGTMQGVEQGHVNGVRESILDVAEARFGKVSAWTVERLDHLTDLVTLEALRRKGAVAPSLNQLEVEIRRYTDQ